MQETPVLPVETGIKISPRLRVAGFLDRVVFFGLLAVIALIAIPYGSVEAWWEAVFECLVFILSALWLVEGMLSGTWRLPKWSLVLPLLALIGFCLIQTWPLWQMSSGAAGAGNKIWYTISADAFETKRFLFKLIALTLSGLLLISHCSSPGRLRAIIHLVIGIAVASALFGVARQTMQRTQGFFLPYLEKDLGYGQFINQNHFAFLMEMDLGLVLGLIIGRGVRRDRLLVYLATLLPVWTALVLSNSRGGLLAMLGQLIFVVLLFTMLLPSRELESSHDGLLPKIGRLVRTWPVRIVLALSLVIAMTIGIVWVGGDPVINKIGAVRGELGEQQTTRRAGDSRKEVWRSTWLLIKDYPLAGVGFGGYWAIIPRYHDASGELTPQQAHNDYLELLASGGIIGLLLGLWFIIVFLNQARRRLRSPDAFRRAACFGALAGIFGVAVHSFVDFGLHVTINALVFTCLIVIATVNGRVEDVAHLAGEREQRRAVLHRRRGQEMPRAGR